MASTIKIVDLRRTASLAGVFIVTVHEGQRVDILERTDEFVRVRLRLVGAAEGWLPSSAVVDTDPPGTPIKKDEFIEECAHQERVFRVPGHYIAAIAQLRSGIITSGTADGFVNSTVPKEPFKEMGLFQLTLEEWLADWNSQADFGFKFVASDIDDWRNQCTLFALMARRSLDECEKALGSRPSAVDLLLAQLIGAKATANLKGAQGKSVKEIIGGVDGKELPRGGLTPDQLMARHAKLLGNAAGAPLKGNEVLTLVAAVLGASLTASKTIFPPDFIVPITDANSSAQISAAVGTSAPAGTLAMARQAFDRFIAAGWTKAQACGIIANIQAESSFNFKNTTGDGGAAHGLCQWHPDRQKHFEDAFGLKIAQSTFEQQLDFITFEMNHLEHVAGDALKLAATPAAAADVVCRKYERPLLPDKDSRIRMGLADAYARSVP